MDSGTPDGCLTCGQSQAKVSLHPLGWGNEAAAPDFEGDQPCRIPVNGTCKGRIVHKRLVAAGVSSAS
jgi:hypothetical protein